VQRADGLVSLYEQARWAEEPAWTWPSEIVDDRDIDDEQPHGFAEAWHSLPGLFDTADEAEAEARATYGYNEAFLTTE